MITLSTHPIYKQAYDVIQAIEKCGASAELTNAVTEAGKLMESVKKLIKSNETPKGEQVPVAYVTSDGKMLIFADSPNMLPEDKSSLTPLFKRDKKTGNNDDCQSCDRHYVDGMKAGWNFHEEGDNQGFIDSIERVQKDMREARKG